MRNINVFKLRNNPDQKLVADIQPISRVKHLSRKALGIHSEKSSVGKIFSLSWRIIFGGLFIFWAISGVSPFELIDRSIFAQTEKIAKVNFYASSAEGGEESVEKSAGKPQLKKGDRSFYSSENSTIIGKPGTAVVLSGFELDGGGEDADNFNSNAEAESNLEQSGEINGGQSGDEEELPGGTGVDASSVSTPDVGIENEMIDESGQIEGENIIDEETSGEDLIESISIPEYGDEFIGPKIEDALPDAPNVEAEKPEAGDEVEVIEVEPINAESEVGVVETDDSGLVASALANVKNYFSAMKAWAEHEEGEFDKKYGKFMSARIGVSLNMRLSEASVDSGVEVPDETEVENVESLDGGVDPTDNAPESDMVVESPTRDADIEADESTLEGDNEQPTVETDANAVGSENVEEDAEGVDEELEGSEVDSGEDAEGDGLEDAHTMNDLFSIMRAYAQDEQAESRIDVWYSLGDQVWQKLGLINPADAELNNYFYFDADGLRDWEDVEHLNLKIEAIMADGQVFTAYLDSAWAEVSYESLGLEVSDLIIEFLSENDVVKLNETGRLRFRYKKVNQGIISRLAENSGLSGFWDNVKLTAILKDSEGKVADVPVSIVFEENGEFTFILPEDRSLVPGEYTIEFSIEDSGAEKITATEDFSWGVLAVNVNKSVYRPGEKAFLQMAVLDSAGHTICDVDARLDVSAPDGTVKSFFTSDGTIERNPLCDSNSVINSPDYSAYFNTTLEGVYHIKLAADFGNGVKEITDSFEVLSGSAYDVERVGPTRIYPKADYEMKILVKPVEDFKGDISEVVPNRFKIPNYKLQITNNNNSDPFGAGYFYEFIEGEEENNLVWHDVEIGAGETLEITYTFDAPDVSPELYAVGPLSVQIENRKSLVPEWGKIENRRWQIASDAISKRAKTVMFQAGTWSETAAGLGRSTNNDYTFTAFSWKLAETGVVIKNAYVIFESQYEAYSNTGGAYTGYKLGFDSCSGSACASAFGTGAGQVLDNNSSFLAYDEAESNITKLLLDVTNETQLAAYTGGGAQMESQIGYHIKNGTTKTSIANASAMLVITYVYDVDTANLTNTVVYPLDSTNGTDLGSRQAAQNACTADNNCPTFGYKMDLPEWPEGATTTNRISQWFKFFAGPQNNTTTDVRPYLDIQTYNVDSSAFHLEETNSGNGVMPNMYFPGWTNSGFAENQTQSTEYYSNTTNYIIGGEVFDTYQASSSAAVKTRTVSFPIGMIINGNSTASSSNEVMIYFPENGTGTGTVDIKSAWVRLYSHGHISSTNTYTASVATKAGNNATTSNLVYNFRAPVAALNPALNIIHIIPSGDYTELEGANAATGKLVRVNIIYNNTGFGGASAELMITYTYSSEASGYLSGLKLFGGQSSGNPATSSVLSTANSVFPEPAGKTIFAAGLFASFYNSDNLGAVPASTFLLDANLAASDPACSPAYRAIPDAINSYSEIMDTVNGVISTTDNQTYSACYAVDDTAYATDGAKINGQLVYAYGWLNSPPTGSFITASTTYREEGSNIADIGLEIDDPDDQDARAKLEFATGTTCVFSPSGDPQIDETDANIFADFGDPYVENDNEYQIGTADGYIKTASGSNSVFVDWQVRESLGSVEGDYCLRLTANDLNLSQATSATTTIYVDTLKPTVPGALSLNSRTGSSITLNYGATSTETNFYQYIIYYQEYDGTDPTEADSVFGSTSDAHLISKTFAGYATTTISLPAGKQMYSFAIWAYDLYGNKASSSRADISTNDAPVGWWNTSAMPAQKSDGSGKVDISIKASDLNQDGVKARIDYVSGGVCDFSEPQDPYLDPTSLSAAYGTPQIDNDWPFQVGTSTNLITTSLENTVSFDWLTKPYLSSADGTYCLRLYLRDDMDDQLIATTTTLTLDNVDPAPTASLSFGEITVESIELLYASTSPGSDTNEPAVNAYKIFYRPGTGDVTELDTEIDRTDLNSYDYNSATSTSLTGLLSNTWYFFKIWTYDAFGNKSSSTETSIKTNATINNDSLVFSNSLVYGPVLNIAAAGAGNIWNFRAVVAETNGWYAIASTTLRLADYSDNTAPYDDLVFYWDQTADEFYEIGSDSLNAASLLPSSSSDCSGNICTLDFNISFNKTFRSTSTSYSAYLYSANDSGALDEDSYSDLYQVRFPTVRQIHYRWRNDDGGQ